MKTSQDGISLITKFEGCRLEAYPDVGGVWTIGYGHTGNVKPGQVITKAEAQLYLIHDLGNSERYVNLYDKFYEFTQKQFDALVSFTYNCGPGNLGKLLDSGKKPIELVHYDLPNTCIKAKGKVLNGLIKRRKAEADYMGDCKQEIKFVVQDVLDGRWGNGAERKKKLTDVGYDYNLIQSAINEKLKK